MSSENMKGRIGACILPPLEQAQAAFKESPTLATLIHQIGGIRRYQKHVLATVHDIDYNARISHELAMGIGGAVLLAVGVTALYLQAQGAPTLDPVAFLHSNVAAQMNDTLTRTLPGLGIASVSKTDTRPLFPDEHLSLSEELERNPDFFADQRIKDEETSERLARELQAARESAQLESERRDRKGKSAQKTPTTADDATRYYYRMLDTYKKNGINRSTAIKWAKESTKSTYPEHASLFGGRRKVDPRWDS